MLSFALRRKSGESPSAPPITKIVLATCSSRQRPRCRAKAGAVDVVAALVERHQHGFFRNCRRNRRGFLGHPGRGVARAAFGNFMDLEAAKAELAADVVEALAIAFGQFPLRALLQPADCNDDEAHRAFSGKARTSGLPQKMRQIDDSRAFARAARYHALEPIRIGSNVRSPSPPSGPASTISRDCRIRAPRV